ncbi:MAG TPA: hypothetical protein VLA43_01810 [Longimicrobiales bacterium]|nr:hypothetical protein [Longimicrobiales bacterium]
MRHRAAPVRLPHLLPRLAGRVGALTACAVLLVPGGGPGAPAGPADRQEATCGFSLTVGGRTYAAQPGDRAMYMPDLSRNDGIITVTLLSAPHEDKITFAMGGAPVVPGSYEVSNVGGTLAWGGEPLPNEGYARFSADRVSFELMEYTPHTRLVGRVTGTVRDAREGSRGEPLALNAAFTISPDPDGGSFLDRYCDVPLEG